MTISDSQVMKFHKLEEGQVTELRAKVNNKTVRFWVSKTPYDLKTDKDGYKQLFLSKSGVILLNTQVYVRAVRLENMQLNQTLADHLFKPLKRLATEGKI